MTEKRFILGNSKDTLEIFSYLCSKKLITNIEGSEEKLNYNLTQGRVSIDYDKDFDLAQVIVSEDVPNKISNFLDFIGEHSRIRRETKGYGSLI